MTSSQLDPRVRKGAGRGVAALLCGIALAACSSNEPDRSDFEVPSASVDTPREACAQRDARGVPLFGDLHVHTTLSSDAKNYHLGLRPSDAYAFAFGNAVLLPPNDAQGAGTRTVSIDRPLDFVGVTDHAEFLGMTALCADSNSEAFDTETCEAIRASTAPVNSPLAQKIMNPFASRESDVCGDDGARCDAARNAAWRETIAAAEQWNDTSSACQRTAFVAYEYSSFRLGSNLHRNVIFRSSVVPERPLSFIEAAREWDLWEVLKENCNDSGTGCQALAIPHNSNISNGRMFSLDYPGASSAEEQAERAKLRIAMEPIVEIMQHKGDSECRQGLTDVLGSDDPLCDFEKFENFNFRRFGEEGPGECYEGPMADWLPRLGPSCLSRRSYVRYALADGLAEEARIGVNPFKFGITASTDTHNALAGGVEERSFPGHLGMADADPKRRLNADPDQQMGNVSAGPGGLIGVWAEENSRAAIFDAMRRKEVFGTSGPRIAPRFYAGWDLPEDLCERSDPLAVAQQSGAPMGGDIAAPATKSDSGPAFALWATRDVGTATAPGGKLQRLQIIKGWVDDDGVVHEQVVDIAGGENGASVDAASCEPTGPGNDALCAVWRDPEFDADRRAVYYGRVVENPSCRFSAWQCLQFPKDERPSGCDDPLIQDVQQERAWTSPVWYTPPS